MKTRPEICQVVQALGTVELGALKEHLLPLRALCEETDSRVVPKTSAGDTEKWPGTGPQRSQWAGTKWEAGEAMKDSRQEAGGGWRKTHLVMFRSWLCLQENISLRPKPNKACRHENQALLSISSVRTGSWSPVCKAQAGICSQQLLNAISCTLSSAPFCTIYCVYTQGLSVWVCAYVCVCVCMCVRSDANTLCTWVEYAE